MSSRVIIFGTVPPPTGGVRIFNKKLYEALLWKGFYVRFFPFLVPLFFDYSFINYSLPWKRFLAVFLSRFFYFSDTRIIVHSSFFEPSIFNRLSVFLSRKVIVTESSVAEKKAWRKCKKFLVVDGLLFDEFFSSRPDSEKKGKKLSSFRFENKKVVLFYQNNNSFVEERNIYGADLMLEAVKQLPDSIAVVWIDLSGENRFVKNWSNVFYYNEPLDLDGLWSSVHLLVRPTIFDGTAFMVIEALMNGVNVLCSDVPGRPAGVVKRNFTDGQLLAEEIQSALLATGKAGFELPCVLSLFSD